GADHDEPEFSYLSWAGMLFAAGISQNRLVSSSLI
ncbi:hypothetical protein HPR93_30150, partial [Pseudomonas aeruginosa]|nr:hypothetical protein [Pseudomonas aeruginosa]